MVYLFVSFKEIFEWTKKNFAQNISQETLHNELAERRRALSEIRSTVYKFVAAVSPLDRSSKTVCLFTFSVVVSTALPLYILYQP